MQLLQREPHLGQPRHKDSISNTENNALNNIHPAAPLDCRHGDSDCLSVAVADADTHTLHARLLSCCSCFTMELIHR
jgi:hypothetical protein